MRRSTFNTSASSGGVPNNGIFRAMVVSVGDDDLLRVRIPKLGLNNIYEGVPYAGPVPAVGDVVFVSSLEGKSGSFVAFTGVAYEGNTGAPTGDITSVIAGTNLNGGGTAGDVTLNLDNEISISGDLTVGGSFNIVPAGTVVMHGAGTAPSGWLACDGSAVSRTTYADLFASIGTRYGSGDGSTTFNLPGTASLVPVGIAVSGSAGDTTVSGSSALNALALGDQSADHGHTITVDSANANHDHNASSANANASHSHNASAANTNLSHSHSWNKNFNTTNQNADHTHGYQKTNNSNVAANTNNQSASHSHNFNSGTVNTNNALSNHSHTITVNSGNANHSHGITVDSGNANHTHNANAGNQSANHNHALSSSTVSTTINVEPFLFIIKT